MPDVSLAAIPIASPAAADKVLGVKDGITKQLDAGPSFGQLAAGGGSALTGHVASGPGAVIRTVQAKLRDTVSVKDFGAMGDGLTDDTSAFQAATTALGAGGTLYVPAGIYVVNRLITLPQYSVLQGAGFRATTIRQRGAFFAVKLGDCGAIQDLAIAGTSAALGGIDIDTCGLGYVHNVDVSGFTNTGAPAIRVNESYRIKLSYLYIYGNYTGIKFSGNVTAFEFSKGNIATSSYRALEGNGGANNSYELYFNTVYFESNIGDNPIYLNHTGAVVFTSCGFEANCGSCADAKVIQVANPTELTLRSCRFAGFNSTTFAYTGTAYFVYLGNDVPRFVMDDCSVIQNFPMTGFTFRMVRSANTGTVSLTNSRLYGTGVSDDLEAQRMMLGGFSVTYPPRSYTFSNNRARNAYVQRSRPVAITEAVVTSSGSSATLHSKQFPAGAFHNGAALKIKAWGRRVGTAGTKTVQLGIRTDTLTTWLMTAAVTQADDWASEVVILFRSARAQSLSVVAHDGAAVYTASILLTKDTAGFDTTTSVLAVCSNASDSISLDGLVMEWL